MQAAVTECTRLAILRRPVVKDDSSSMARGSWARSACWQVRGVYQPRRSSRHESSRLPMSRPRLRCIEPGHGDRDAPSRPSARSLRIDAQFPPYEDVISRGTRRSSRVDRLPLIDAPQRAQLMSLETRGVKVAATRERVTITCDNPDPGEVREEFEVEYSSDASPVWMTSNGTSARSRSSSTPLALGAIRRCPAPAALQ